MSGVAQPSERLRFPGSHGVALAARLDRPEGTPRGWALFAHCFTCGKDLRSLGGIARELVANGIGVVRFDFTGIGESEGEFARTTLSSNIDDLLAAAQFMRREIAPADFLLGHSLGGAAVLAVAGRLPEVRAVATLAAPADTSHFRARLESRVPGLARSGEGEIVLGGGTFRIRRELLDDLDRYDLATAAATLGKPLLVLHSPDDRTVAIAQAELLFARARQPKSFVCLDGADHLLLNDERQARAVGAILAAWAGRYLD